jgi:hypothetical protein
LHASTSHDKGALYNYLEKDKKDQQQFYMSLTFAQQEAVDRFLHLEKIKNQLKDIKDNKKSKFRLRDLQKIDDNVEILDEIYKQRT